MRRGAGAVDPAELLQLCLEAPSWSSVATQGRLTEEQLARALDASAVVVAVYVDAAGGRSSRLEGGQRLVGCARATSDLALVGELVDLAVAGHWQDKGLGKLLIDEVRQACCCGNGHTARAHHREARLPAMARGSRAPDGRHLTAAPSLVCLRWAPAQVTAFFLELDISDVGATAPPSAQPFLEGEGRAPVDCDALPCLHSIAFIADAILAPASRLHRLRLQGVIPRLPHAHAWRLSGGAAVANQRRGRGQHPPSARTGAVAVAGTGAVAVAVIGHGTGADGGREIRSGRARLKS